MSETNLEYNPASQRHWVYGFNAFVLVVIGLVVIIFLMIICNMPRVKQSTHWDWSNNGINSLSGGTRKMLQEIDQKKQKYTLVSLFTDPTDEEKRENPKVAAQVALHRKQITDLLNQYKKNSTYISFDDQGDASRDKIETSIREKYAKDLEPYKQAVSDFDPIVKKLSEFLKTEAAAIGAAGQKTGATPEEVQTAAIIQAQFSKAPAEFDQVQRMIHRESSETLPQWSKLTRAINDNLSDLQALFEVLGDAGKVKEAGFPPALVTYFTSAHDKYKTIADELKAYKDHLAKLEPLKMDEVINGLEKDTVLILGENAAKLIPAVKLYTGGEAQPNGTNAPEAFNGEQAISSALFAMARPEKVKVVFVTASPERLLTDVYSYMKDTLEDNNFEVLEWSPPSQTPDNPQPPPANPPAEGAGVVWVVFPPSMPNQQMMMMGMGMPNAQGVIAATRKHMDAGGQVLFMAEPSNSMMGMGPSGFAYDDLIKDFGIDVLSKYTVEHLEQGQDQSGRTVSQTSPYVEINRFEDHQITAPMLSLPAVFGPIPGPQGGGMGFVTVVNVHSPLPANVEAKVLVKSAYSSDYWGETDPSQTAKFDPANDFAAPVPLAAVAIKDKGQKDKERRIAVFGCKFVGANYLQDIPIIVERGGLRFRVGDRFPGNGELMKNTILWLAGYENMIAVSAKANASARIGDVKPATLFTIRVAMVPLIPLCALLIGIFVWVARRK